MKSILCRNEDKEIVLKRGNYSNPNTYNALDSAVAFLVFALLTVALKYAISPLIQKIYQATNDYMLAMCISVLAAQGMILLVAFIFSRIKKVGFLSGGGFACRFDAVDALFGILLCFGVFFLLNATHYSFIDDWTWIIYLTDYETHTSLIAVPSDLNPLLTVIYSFILVPLLPAICEEALFRGVIMRGLRQFGDLFAVICSAFIFAIMHGGYEQIVLQFAIGLMIGGAVMISNNIFVGMAMHFSYNFGVIALTAMPEILNGFLPFYNYLYDASGVILGFVFIITGFIYYGFKFIGEYKRKILKKPKIVRFQNYYVLENDLDADGKQKAYSYAAVLPEYYKKDTDYRFYSGNRFCKFNKQSNKIAPVIILAIATIIAVLQIIISA